jgi:1-phosphofructokinase family hexose kinase
MILSVCPNPSIDTYAWLDNFEPGGVNRIKKLEEYPGGKGVHVALAIAELGVSSKLLANWAGNNGDWIKKECSNRNIEISGIQLPGNNRKCYTFRSKNFDFQNTELLEPGPSLYAKNLIEFKDKFKSEIAKASLICMSGSWPKNSPNDAYAQLIEIAGKSNVKVILDCTGVQLEEALIKGFFGLHLNQHEAMNLCGSSNIKDLLRKLNGKVKLVALTKGKDGLDLFYNNQILTSNVAISNVVSTVGSGDCLTAGIAFAVFKKFEIKKIAAYGVACGAANCLSEALGMIKKEDVEKLLPKVQINKSEYEH